MAIERELRWLLELAYLPDPETASASGSRSANARPVRVTAVEIYAHLEVAVHQTVVPLHAAGSLNLAELLVLIAEAAIHQRDYDTANKSATWYLSECQVKNQFYCRMQFVRAHCAAWDARQDIGALKLRKILNAVHFVLLALPVAATRRPQYDFLVYNASITYWTIARPLMKKSTYQFIAPSLTKIMDALKTTGEKDMLWLARLQLALVHAQVDAKQLATAAKCINDLVDTQLAPLLMDFNWNSSADFHAIYEEALRVQIHVGSFKDPECQKIVPTVKKVITAKRALMVLKLQCIKSNAISGTMESAYVDLVQEAIGLVAFSLSLSDAELTAAVQSLASETIDTEIVVEVALHAAFHNNFRFAYCCEIVLQLKGKQTKDPKIRVLHDVLKGVLLVMEPIQQAIRDKLPLRQRQAMLLSRRIEAVKIFERALLASKRQQNPMLIESVCLYAWNLSMPLLQPHVSNQLTRMYSLSTQALEEIESLILELRARLHLEAARLDFSSDFLVKANAHVNKGLLLDYGTIVDHASGSITIDDLCKHENEWAIRPVDIHLAPLKKNIELKLTPDDPETCEDQVKILLGQLKERKDKTQQATLLDKSVALLNKATEPIDETDEQRTSVELLTIWCEISCLAWLELHDRQKALYLTEKTLTMYFAQPEGSNSSSVWHHEKSFMILEVDLRMRMIELLAAEIKARLEEYEQAKFQADALKSSNRIKQQSRTQSRHNKQEQDVELAALVQLAKESFMLGINCPCDANLDMTNADENNEAATLIKERSMTLNQDILKMKNCLLANVVSAIQTATQIGWTFVIENTCTYLWNYHFHVFRKLLCTSYDGDKSYVQWILPEFISAFEAAYASLDAISVEHPDSNTELLTFVGLGLATIYENLGRWEKALPLADAFLKRKATGSLPGAVSLHSNMVSCLQLKYFAELKTRGQLAQNSKEIVPVDGSNDLLKVVSYLEAVETILRLEMGSSGQQFDRAQALYEKSVLLWSSISGDQIEAIDANPSDHTIEELQRQMELYIEIWVRVGCCAFRFQHFRYAIECAERALRTLSSSRSLIAHDAWSWITLAEILCSRGILALSTGETIIWQLILAALKHLVNASKYSVKYTSAPLLAKKAGEIAWNAVILVIADESGHDNSNQNETDVSWKKMIELMVTLLIYLREASESLHTRDAEFYGEMVLLVLKTCEKSNEWTQVLAVCDGALAATNGQNPLQLSTAITNEIRTFQAIASAQIGKQPSSGNNSGGGKDGQLRDSVLQAQILRKIAFSSWKDPPAQLRAYSAAFAELDGKPEEQAIVLLDFAEWLHTNQFPWQDIDAYLHSATNVLIACQQRKVDERRQTSTGTTSVSCRSEGASSSFRSDVNVRVYSSLWLTDKLVRVFAMRAIIASTCSERWTYAIHAVNQVQNAWVEIINIRNEVDAQTEFEKLGSGMEFDKWKQSRPSKFEPPHTWKEWIAFYITFDITTDSRFYMAWTKALKSASTTNILHLTQPVLTGFFLERLLDMLQENGQFEFMLPTICLYQLLFHVYFPQKTKTMEIWLELTLFGLLERLNLSIYALPLQKALDLLQEHANAIVKEVQLSSAESRGSLRTCQTRNRVILQATQVNLVEKANATAELFLRFGFVRQAKTMLEVVCASVEQLKDPSDQNQCACLVLKSKIVDMEGQHALASATFERALASESIDLLQLIKWTHEYACLVLDKSKALQRLQELSQKAIFVVLENGKASEISLQGHAQSKSADIGDEVSGKRFDLDGILAVANIKFKCSDLILISVLKSYEQDSHGTQWIALLDTSRNTLQECINLYTLVGSRRQIGVALATYSKRLLNLYSLVDQRCSLFQEAQLMAQRAVSLFESLHFSVKLSEIETETSEIATTLEIDIASTKLLLAEIELLLSQSTEVVQQEDMTWYRFDEDSKRHVVMKWLHQTATELKRDKHNDRSDGNLSRAMMLATASAALYRGSGQDEHSAMAEALALQCARLTYFRGDAQKKIQKRLWTRFTSSDASHATWICCSHLQIMSSAATTSKEEGVEFENEPQDEVIDDVLLEMTNKLEAYQRIALEKRDMTLLQLCSYELVQTFGCHRPLECVRSLLMYQSVLVRAYLVDIFDKCASPTNLQKLHLARMQKLQEIHRNAAANSTPYQLSKLYLDQQSDAVKRMSVLTPVDVILATLPPQLRIFTLQFSPDRCFLYAALVGNGDRHFAMARMECIDTMHTQLKQLRERVESWRQSYGKTILEYEDKAARDEDSDFVAMDSLANQQLSCFNDAVEKEFSGILIDMIELFSPLFGHSTLQSELQNELPNNPLILLVDRELALLPLEALPAFDKADSISRDFSVHVLYKRLLAAKTQPLRRDDIRVIVDPHKEDPGINGNTMDTVVQQFMKRNNAPFLNWKDAVDHGQVPSVDDWQQVMMGRRGGGLLYVGANRVVGSCLPFERLMAMNLSLNCHVLLLLDRAENAKSIRRQSKLDSEKCAWELTLEDDSYATAALLTLSGINVLLLNQWPTTFTSNRRLANGLLTGLGKGFPIGKALKKHMESTSTSLSLESSGGSTTASAASLAASAVSSNTSSSASLATSPQRPTKRQLKNRLRYNPVIYGLAYMALRSGE